MHGAFKYAAGFILPTMCFLFADNVKVLPVFDFRFESSKNSFIKKTMSILEKNGIVFVKKDPDLVLLCGKAKVATCEKYAQYPMVILDESEPASLGPTLKKCLKNQMVKAVFKNTVLRPEQKNNEPTVKATYTAYHFKIINDGCKKFAEQKSDCLSDQELQKIRCVLWDTHRSLLRADLEVLKDEKIDFNKDRPIDVFFAGTLWPEGALRFHRQQAFGKLSAIQGYNILIQKNRLPIDEFFKFLRNSKIAVSPWGQGEWCWRDYEAIFLGAVLIKPDTSFVQSIPDLYQNDRYYVPCKPDFSDLEEKITYVLNNYSQFMEMRMNARILLVDGWDYEKHVRKLAEEFKRVFEEYSCDVT